jgi:enterochelin esterase family protein
MLRVLLALALLALAAPASAELRWSQSFRSAALGAEMTYSIYLPGGYHDPRRAEERFPVLYLLHGVGDNERAWPAYGRAEATLNRMIAGGEIPPLIVVMPAAKKSWFVDSAAIGGPGDFATAVADDLRAHVETTYRARSDRAGRHVAGLSMGGFGALRLAFSRPELYASAGAFSAALWWRVEPGWVPTRPDRMVRIFDGSFGDPWSAEHFLALHPRAYLDAVAAMEVRPALYLMAGDDDVFGAWKSTTQLYEALKAREIPAELRIADGGHVWALWRAGLAPYLRWLAGQMDPQAGQG